MDKKDLGGKGLKTLGKADDKNKAVGGGAPEKQKELGDVASNGNTPTPSPASLGSPTSGLPKNFSLPQAGVDPQLYVTITISVIIVLVATGIIFKFW